MGKVDVKPSLFSKTSLLTKTSVTRPLDSVSGRNSVPQKIPRIESTAVHQKNEGGTCKPSLFNKSLAVGSQDNGGFLKPIIPSLFSQQNLLPNKPKDNYSKLIVDDKQKKTERKERKRKLRYNLSKQSLLEKINVSKIPAKVTQNAGKPKKMRNITTSEKKKGRWSKKKKDAKIEFVTAKMKEFKLADDDFKKDQLRIMRNKLKQESEGLFVDSKQGNFDLMKQEKEKVTREKVYSKQNYK